MARNERNGAQQAQGQGGRATQQYQGYQTSGQWYSGGADGQRHRGYQHRPAYAQQQGGYDGPGQQERIGSGIAHDYGNSASWATSTPQANEQVSNDIISGDATSPYHSTSLSQSPAHKVGDGIDHGYGNSASWAASTLQVKERMRKGRRRMRRG